MKKYKSSQELVSVFPPWARVRQDESVGYQFLNTVAGPMDKMTNDLTRYGHNTFLVTANLDEIDLTYKVILPTTFEFDEDDTDPLYFSPIPPVVSGLIDSTWYEVTISGDNNVEDFWYNSVPNRASLEETGFDIDDHITTITGLESALVSGVHHLDAGGYLWIEMEGGTQYLTVEEDNLKRGQIQIYGTTRKGTEESEIIIYPWDMKQRSTKEWQEIDNIRLYNLEDTVVTTVRSSDFSNGPYIDFYNTAWSDNRRKVDQYWDLETVSGMTQLNLLEYVSDEWESLVLGFIEQETVESYLLLDQNGNTQSLVDMTIQPFTNRMWTCTTSGTLLCYDLLPEMPDVSLIKDRTPGTHVIFEVDFDKVVIGEEMVLTPWHARPVKEIQDYQIWYQTPSGDRYGLLNGNPVSISSDFRVVNQQLLSRTVEGEIRITATESGSYMFVIEVTFVDGEEHKEMKIISSLSKLPLTSIDISSLVSADITGLDFDSDQKLWVKDVDNNIHKLNLHTDVMTVDYDQKIIYLKEEYEEIEVFTDD